MIVENARLLYNLRYGWKIFSNECSSKQNIDALSIADYVNGDAIYLFPNPTSGEINIVSPSFGNQLVEISVTDITGRCIYKNKHQLEQGKTQFNLNCASGAYIVTLSSGEQKANIKLIIQK
ncbi:MAG: T9SS type A sorting domain-containing protein [Bacteroidia bacterium]|nr:T9SS type A sorting domain-containing protein [Bacteroidia bacterium]